MWSWVPWEVLQFDVVAYRLKDEYGVEAIYEGVNVTTARWVECDDDKALNEFKRKYEQNLAMDGGDHLTFLAASRVNLVMAEERFPISNSGRLASTDDRLQLPFGVRFAVGEPGVHLAAGARG